VARKHGGTLDVEISHEPSSIEGGLRMNHHVLTQGSVRGIDRSARAGRGGLVVHGQIGLCKFVLKDL